MECLFIRDEDCILAHLLPPIIIGNDIKDEHISLKLTCDHFNG